MNHQIFAYNLPDVRHTLDIMGLDQADLGCIYDVLDQDKSNEVSYNRFIDAFIKAQGQDLRVYLMMQKMELEALANTVTKLSETLLAHSGLTGNADANSAAAPAAPAAPQRPPGAASGASGLPRPSDVDELGRRIEQEFAALRDNIRLNSLTLAKHTMALEKSVVPVNFDKSGDMSFEKYRQRQAPPEACLGPSEAHAGSEPFALRELVGELKGTGESATHSIDLDLSSVSMDASSRSIKWRSL
jgi:hypothetical protein